MGNTVTKKFYYKFVPFTIRVKIGRIRRRKVINAAKDCFERQEAHFKSHIANFMFDDERKADVFRIFARLKNFGPSTFPELDVLLCDKYFTRNLTIEKDLCTDLFYVLVDNKKLFYKRNMTKSSVYHSFNSVSVEQDYASPHRYLTNDQYFVGVMTSDIKHVNNGDSFGVIEGGIVVDVGAAEGNFALSVIEKAGKVYIVEGDVEWCEALKQTFLPYKEKVEIIPKYLSDVSEDDHITLKDLMETYHISKIDFLKMDIEGYEKQALHGGVITDDVVSFVDISKLAVCTYHKFEDELEISNFVSRYGYKF